MSILTKPQLADYSTVRGILYALRGKYPFLSMFPIGRSTVGRDLMALSLGNGEQPVLIAAAVHGQEWITTLLLLRLCEELCSGLSRGERVSEIELQRAFIGRRLLLIPQVNPDGVEIALHGSASAGNMAEQVARLGGDIPGNWQANARGVDINHNFNAGWEQLHRMEEKSGIVGPCARRWGGLYPESELETQALCALCRRLPMRYVVALHTQGEEIYWEYGQRTPPQSKFMVEIMSAVSGYRVAEPEGLASHGGFKDWFIESTGKPGFTLEMGRGCNPLPLEEMEEIYAKARDMLLMLAAAM